MADCGDATARKWPLRKVGIQKARKRWDNDIEGVGELSSGADWVG
jgi:hypothetical protein